MVKIDAVPIPLKLTDFDISEDIRSSYSFIYLKDIY